MKYFFSLCFLFLFFTLQGQAPISLALQEKFEEVGIDEKVPVIIQGTESEVSHFLSKIGRKPQYRFGSFTRTSLSYSEIEGVNNQNIKISGGLKGQILNDSVRVLNHALPLHNGEGLPQAYRGKGVIVGILDSGLDYRHQDFNDEEGNSRIYAIWDQRREGTAPSGYDYGLLCDSLSIAQGTCESYDQDWNSWISHGTHVSGTAAGFDQTYDNLYTGMAPEATIIAVGLDFENFATSVIDGAKFIYDIAQAKGMPAVINLSAGTYGGPHDGRNVITYALNDLITASEGRAFVTSVGNGGNRYHHARHNITPQSQFTYFQRANSGVFEWTFYADSINFENAQFQLQIDRRSTLEKMGSTNWLNILADFDEPGNQIIEKQEVVLSEQADTLGRINFYVEKFESRYGVRIVIDKSSSNYYWRMSTKGQGQLDIYSSWPLLRTSNMIRSQSLPSDFDELYAYTSPDLEQNNIGYFGCSREVLTVGFYSSKNTFIGYDGETYTNSNVHPTDLYYKSSRGPSRDGYLKPDLTSTGAVVASAANEDYVKKRIEDGVIRIIPPDGKHIRYNGSSMSSPAVAGGVALLFERYPDLSWQEIKETVWANTYKDEHTGEESNHLWGYGKFSVLNSFNNVIKYGCTDEKADNYDPDATKSENDSCVYSGCTDPKAINFSLIATVDDGSCLLPDNGEDFYFKITPNPVVSSSEITYGLNSLQNSEIIIHNTLGQVVWHTNLTQRVGKVTLNRSNLSFSNQVYFVSLMQDGKILKTRKILLQ